MATGTLWGISKSRAQLLEIPTKISIPLFHGIPYTSLMGNVGQASQYAQQDWTFAILNSFRRLNFRIIEISDGISILSLNLFNFSFLNIQNQAISGFGVHFFH